MDARLQSYQSEGVLKEPLSEEYEGWMEKQAAEGLVYAVGEMVSDTISHSKELVERYHTRHKSNPFFAQSQISLSDVERDLKDYKAGKR